MYHWKLTALPYIHHDVLTFGQFFSACLTDWHQLSPLCRFYCWLQQCKEKMRERKKRNKSNFSLILIIIWGFIIRFLIKWKYFYFSCCRIFCLWLCGFLNFFFILGMIFLKWNISIGLGSKALFFFLFYEQLLYNIYSIFWWSSENLNDSSWVCFSIVFKNLWWLFQGISHHS